MLDVLVTCPPGIAEQWTAIDPETGEPLSTFPFAKGHIPPASVMPGTKEVAGRELCHVRYDGELSELEASFLPNMQIVAAQEAPLRPVYSAPDEEGNQTLEGYEGVVTPVPNTVAAFIALVDEDGSPVAAEPGHPLHTYAGADPWQWAEVSVQAGLTLWDDGNTVWDVNARTNEPFTAWDRRR
jgi:hypothetical protein